MFECVSDVWINAERRAYKKIKLLKGRYCKNIWYAEIIKELLEGRVTFSVVPPIIM